jgi:hypothetical protein
MLGNLPKNAEIAQTWSNSMCNASGTSYKRIHALNVPILRHQETVNGQSDRYDQYFQQLQELGTGTTFQYIVNS